MYLDTVSRPGYNRIFNWSWKHLPTPNQITKAGHRPGFHKRWSANPQPVPIGLNTFSYLAQTPSSGAGAGRSLLPYETLSGANYPGLRLLRVPARPQPNYTHQKTSKEGLKSSKKVPNRNNFINLSMNMWRAWFMWCSCGGIDNIKQSVAKICNRLIV